MMKKNRLFMLRAAVLMVMALFTFATVNAQEEKEEKKVIKIKMMADEDGNVTMDTTIVLDEDFDGNWEDIIDDEDVLKKIKDIHIDLDLDEHKNVYLIDAPHTQKKAYYYSIDEDDGNIRVEVEQGDNLEDIYVTAEGDTTMTFVVKTAAGDKDGEEKIMIWHSKDGDCKHKHTDKEHNVIISKSADMHVDVVDGDSVLTYTIKVDGEEGEKEVMVWSSSGDEDENIEVMLKELGGDSCKVMVVTARGDGEDIKIEKKTEMIIITVEDEDVKKKKKKKKK